MPARSVPRATVGRRALERLGHEHEERRAEERAHGIGDQPRHDSRVDVAMKEQEDRRDQKTANAAGD